MVIRRSLVSANEFFVFRHLPNGTTISCPTISDYMFQDPSGGRHALHLATAYSSTDCGNRTNYVNGGDDFFAASLPNCPTYRTGLCSLVNIADRDGTVFTYDQPRDHLATGGYGSSLPSSLEDRNGNVITVTDNGNGAFAMTDTAGRTSISSSGFGVSGNTLTVSGLTSPYTVFWGSANSSFSVNPSATVPGALCRGIDNVGVAQTVITAIRLPNGQQYQFSYDPTYGLLNKITYPSGGWVKYSWSLNPQSDDTRFPDQNGNVNGCYYTYGWPAVSHRYVSFDGSTTALQQDFTYALTTWGCAGWCAKQTTVTTRDLVRGTSFVTTYSYSPVTLTRPPYEGYDVATKVPVESTVTYNDWNGATLKTLTKAWFDQFELNCELQTLDNGQISGIFYTYFAGQVADRKEYDYGLISSSTACQTGSTAPTGVTPTRETKTSFASFAATPIYIAGLSIFDRPCQSMVYDSGALLSETDYFYDNGATGTQCAAPGTPTVTSVASLPSGTHDETNYAPGSTAPRGNATSRIHTPMTIPARCSA
jgi:hypothetical protein